MTSSPGKARGFLLRHEDLEQSRALWFLLSALPFDVAFYVSLVEPHGGREVPDAPDAVFVEVDLTDEFEFGA